MDWTRARREARQRLADLKPESGLAPPAGTIERYRLQEMLGYINSEIHKTYSPLFRATTSPELRKDREDYLRKRYKLVDNQLAKGPYLFGEQFTSGDEPWERIRQLLGFGPMGRDEVLASLDAAGEASGGYLLLCIDGLNESRTSCANSHGRGPGRWFMSPRSAADFAASKSTGCLLVMLQRQLNLVQRTEN